MTTVNQKHQRQAKRFKRSKARSKKNSTGFFFVSGGWVFRGAKKGGGGSAGSLEMPDTLSSTSIAKLLMLMSEGEIKGPVNGLQSVYLDGTPLQNADGSLNFQGVSVDFRAGTTYQTPIAGFPASESTTSVGIELRSTTPWVQSFNNTELSAVRLTLSVGGLQWIDQTTGNIWGWNIGYAIDVATDGGAYQTAAENSFSGKATSSYSRTHRVELPPAESGWNIRVRRLTANVDSSTVSDTSYVTSYSQVIDANLSYPMSAMLGIQVNAEQFGSVPTVAVDCYGRIIAVPSNYNPDTRQYVGVWDGTFKQAYSNNPAWVFYDLVINRRYGLGRVIDPAYTDKWSLYVIGQYCDEMVPDGKGGTEPRFTCNAYLQTAADAYRVLSDLASIFRGFIYWGHGAAVAVADMPQDTDSAPIFSEANVIDGRFTYSGSRGKTRYTVAMVSWSDPADMNRQKVEVVEDQDGIARYGIQKVELTAFGCTSQAQAHRLGLWQLKTNTLETQAVAFSIGLDMLNIVPGKVIKVADQARAGRRLGGRVRSASSTQIELDAPLLVKPGDKISVTLPSGVVETRTVVLSQGKQITADSTAFTADSTAITADMTGYPETVPTITVSAPFSEVPEPEAAWAIEADDLATQLFRVVSIAEGDDNTFNISAVEHVPGKYDLVDYGTRIETPPISVVPPRVQPAPQNVRLSNRSAIIAGSEKINVLIEWDAAEYATQYEVQWRRNNSNWVTLPRTGVTAVEIEDSYAGDYEARVRAYNSIGSASLWTPGVLTTLKGTLGEPPEVTHLTTKSVVFGIELSWGFPEGANIIERTRIYYSETNDFADAAVWGDYSYPQRTQTMVVQGAGKRLYFWAQLIDRNGLSGQVYPAGTGVLGVSSADASPILEYIKGQITETQLAQALLERIESGEGAAVEVGELVNELAAMYNIKVQYTLDGVPYFAGIGVGVENNEGIITSQILLAAERVAVLDESSGQLVVPFVVQGGQVFINDAIIGQLSAQHIKVNALSELTDDAGILVSGKLQSATNGNFIDLNATGSQQAINFGGGAMTLTANGTMTINAVNVIDTLQIRGNAVTTSVASKDGTTSSGSTSALFRSQTDIYNGLSGARLVLQAGLSFTISGGSSAMSAYLDIVRNGVVLDTISLGGASVGESIRVLAGMFTHQDFPPVGTSTYVLRIRWTGSGNPTCTCTDSSLIGTIYNR